MLLLHIIIIGDLTRERPVKNTSFDMNLIKVLNALFEERSVTKAGERLGRTQSAISNSLKKMRDRMNDPLFVRGADGLVPTPKAKHLQDHVLSIIRLTDLFLSDNGGFDPSSEVGKIRIGAPDRLSLPIVRPLLKRLLSEAPELSIDLVTVDREKALTLLDDDQVDVAIGWIDPPPNRFTAHFLFRERLVCLCRKKHPLAVAGRAMTLSQILSFPHLVVTAAGDRKAAFDIMLEKFGLQRQTRISAFNFAMVPDLLKEGDLIGVYTRRIAEVLARDHNLAVIPLPVDIDAIDHHLVWHNRYHSDRRHQWLRETIFAEVGEDPSKDLEPGVRL